MKAINKLINKEIKTKNSNGLINKYYKKSDSKDFKKKLIFLSPKKVNIKRGISNSIKRSYSISTNNNDGINLKKLALFGQNKNVDLNIVKNLDKKNKKFMEILSIFNKNNDNRDKNEKEIITNFLMKNNIRETVTNDLEYFNISIKKYINYILDHISLQEYGYLDIIYYDKDIPDNFYLILNESNVGEYSLYITEESIDFENYLLYLNDLNILYEKYQEKKIFMQKTNKYDLNEDKNFIDNYLIKKIIDENNKIYTILSYSDIKEAKEILIKTKIYNFIKEEEEKSIGKTEIDITEEEEENKEKDRQTKLNEKIIQIHKDYNAELNIINYDEVINEKVTYWKYMNSFKKIILSDNSFQHYYKLLNNKEKNTIKKIKYKKNKFLKQFEYFGNFAVPTKNKNFETRKYITRSEKSSTLVLCFNKIEYINVISAILKEEKEKNIIFFHDEYIFKHVNMEFFAKKIFSEFKLNFNSKGDIIFKQDENNNNLIMIKEGIIELQIQNTSLYELREKILNVKKLLLKYLKESKMNSTDKLLENVLDVEIDEKTNLQINFVKEFINKKLNIIFSRCSKGLFGEYEFFFKIPSLLTGVVISENSEVYFYSNEKYKDINVNSFTLNEKLEEYSFNKLFNVLKRMCNIYNSYWKIFNNQKANLIGDENINDDNNKINQNILLNNNIKMNNLDNYNNNINNQNINDDNYYIIENNNYNNKKIISNNISNKDLGKLKISNPLLSQTILRDKFQKIINNIESIKNNKLMFRNRINQVKEKKEKKFKIKHWDFNFENKYDINSINSERLRFKNFNNILLTERENNKDKVSDTVGVNKSSVITNNFLKTKIKHKNKPKKIDKKALNSICLPPILKTREINNDNNYPSNRYYNSIKNDRKFDGFFNNDKKQNIDYKYLYSKSEKKRNKINFDVKKVSINYLKSRKKKYIKINLLDNDEYDYSWGEYLYTNE